MIIKKTLVVTLGPTGTFSEDVGKIIARRVLGKLILLQDWKAVAQNVADNLAEYGVMAYENTLSGKVVKSIAAMEKHNLKEIYRLAIPIKMAIGEHPDNIDRSKVHSYENALNQCTAYLDANNILNKIYEDSTATAAEKVYREKTGLAIGKLETLLANGLKIIETDIANKNQGKNETIFCVVRK